MSMQSLKRILQSKLRATPLGADVLRAQIIEESRKIMIGWFGQEVVGRISALFIKGATLHIVVATPVLGQEISLRREQLLEELKKRFGPHITAIQTSLR